MSPTTNEEEEYTLLCTRADTYSRADDNVMTPGPSAKRPKIKKYSLRDSEDDVPRPFEESLPNGKLPLGKQVLGYYRYILQECSLTDTGQTISASKSEAVHSTALDISLHWIFNNVYTVSVHTVKKKLNDLLKEWQALLLY